jgi:hypothetical protein
MLPMLLPGCVLPVLFSTLIMVGLRWVTLALTQRKSYNLSPVARPS